MPHFHSNQNYEMMAKRKRLGHEKLQLELNNQKVGFQENASYKSKTAYADNVPTIATNLCILHHGIYFHKESQNK